MIGCVYRVKETGFVENVACGAERRTVGRTASGATTALGWRMRPS